MHEGKEIPRRYANDSIFIEYYKGIKEGKTASQMRAICTPKYIRRELGLNENEKYNTVELFGKKLKIIDDKDCHYPCIKCALYSLNLKNCTILDKRPCDSSLSDNNRHFEEIK